MPHWIRKLNIISLIVLGLVVKLELRSYGQTLQAETFIMPLGNNDGFIYSPHTNTEYGIHNVGLQGLSTCFGVDWGV